MRSLYQDLQHKKSSRTSEGRLGKTTVEGESKTRTNREEQKEGQTELKEDSEGKVIE